MSYDALRRLLSWQNAPGSSPTASEQYAYDGEGNRVWQQATSANGSTTTTTATAYVLGIDELTTTSVTGQQAVTTNVRTYPLPGGHAVATRDGTGLYDSAVDLVGTPIATLHLDDGALVGTQLRTPYGQARYSSAAAANGGLHTSLGFTGQREDTQAPGSSGLDYFTARYYDPLIGRFTSADDVVGSDPLLDGYAYVGGMVESATDPSGHAPPPGVCKDNPGACATLPPGCPAVSAACTGGPPVVDPEDFEPEPVDGGWLGVGLWLGYQVYHWATTGGPAWDTTSYLEWTSDTAADVRPGGHNPTYTYTPSDQTDSRPDVRTGQRPPRNPTSSSPTTPKHPQPPQGPGNNGGNTGNGNGDSTWDHQITTYVIGETMTRVIDYAQQHGYQYYRPWGLNKGKNPRMFRNLQWLWRLTQQGVRIVDIGPDSDRELPSKFYRAETALLDAIDYWNWIIDPDPGV